MKRHVLQWTHENGQSLYLFSYGRGKYLVQLEDEHAIIGQSFKTLKEAREYFKLHEIRLKNPVVKPDVTARQKRNK